MQIQKPQTMQQTMPYSAVFTGIGYHIPPNKVTNDDLVQRMNTTNEWIVTRTGIESRHYCDTTVSTSDMAVLAVQDLCAKYGHSLDSFDYLIAATLSPDYYFPGIAVMIQHKLGMKPMPCLDIRQQCSAFVYSTQLCQALIGSGVAKKILLVMADKQHPALDYSDEGRHIAALFADGAAAMVFESQPTNQLSLPVHAKMVPYGMNHGIVYSKTFGDGVGAEVLGIHAPGTAYNPENNGKFISEELVRNKKCVIRMEGQLVFKNAVVRMVECIEQAFQETGLTLDDIALVIPHQANLRISDFVQKKLGIPDHKIKNNIQRFGNTTSPTIAICLAEALADGQVVAGDLVVTVAFGAGFTWGVTILRV
jgi:3-oxoacyl-[acyl-carrier-protein] synthase III